MRVFVFVSFIAVVLQVTMANKRYGAPVYVAAPAEADNDSGNDEYTRDCHGEGGCVYESNCAWGECTLFLISCILPHSKKLFEYFFLNIM